MDKQIEAIDSKRKKGVKPKLKSQRDKEDSEDIKRKLQERIELASLNRQREIEKLQAKLARHEERAKRVLERKHAMYASNEELRLSVGGECDLAGSTSLNSAASVNKV